MSEQTVDEVKTILFNRLSAPPSGGMPQPMAYVITDAPMQGPVDLTICWVGYSGMTGPMPSSPWNKTWVDAAKELLDEGKIKQEPEEFVLSVGRVRKLTPVS